MKEVRKDILFTSMRRVWGWQTSVRSHGADGQGVDEGRILPADLFVLRVYLDDAALKLKAVLVAGPEPPPRPMTVIEEVAEGGSRLRGVEVGGGGHVVLLIYKPPMWVE